MQAMVCELFTNFDQKAGRKSITCGASSEKRPAVPISPLLHESNVSAPSKDSLISASVLLFLAEFLKARIVPEWIEHGIEPEQRRSERTLPAAQRTFVRHREYFL
jgi:hypothetical protein